MRLDVLELVPARLAGEPFLEIEEHGLPALSGEIERSARGGWELESGGLLAWTRTSHLKGVLPCLIATCSAVVAACRIVEVENYAEREHRRAHDESDPQADTQATSLPRVSITRRGILLWRRVVLLPLPYVYCLGVQLAPPVCVLWVFLFLVIMRFLHSPCLHPYATRPAGAHTCRGPQ